MRSTGKVKKKVKDEINMYGLHSVSDFIDILGRPYYYFLMEWIPSSYKFSMSLHMYIREEASEKNDSYRTNTFFILTLISKASPYCRG